MGDPIVMPGPDRPTLVPAWTTNPDNYLLRACVERYIADMRKACEEDQGDPDGKPGTVGHDVQRRLGALLAWVDTVPPIDLSEAGCVWPRPCDCTRTCRRREEGI